MKFIDSPKKRLAWYSRNYFYIATVAVVVTNIALYACLGNSWTFAFGNGSVRWERSFDFQRIWRCFLNNFSHGTWQHALLNMLCFFIAGLYLERKTGSLGLSGLVLSLAVLQGCVCAAAKGDPCASTAALPKYPLPFTLMTFCTISGTERDFSAVRSSRCSFSCPWRRRAAAQRNRRLPVVHNTIAAPPAGSRRGCADQGPVLSKMHSRRKRLSASRYFSESSRL